MQHRVPAVASECGHLATVTVSHLQHYATLNHLQEGRSSLTWIWPPGPFWMPSLDEVILILEAERCNKKTWYTLVSQRQSNACRRSPLDTGTWSTSIKSTKKKMLVWCQLRILALLGILLQSSLNADWVASFPTSTRSAPIEKQESESEPLRATSPFKPTIHISEDSECRTCTPTQKILMSEDPLKSDPG